MPKTRAINFAPQAGTLDEGRIPGRPRHSRRHARVRRRDVPPYYDSMLAKIVAFGEVARRGDRADGTRAARNGDRRRATPRSRMCLEILARRNSAKAATTSDSCRRFWLRGGPLSAVPPRRPRTGAASAVFHFESGIASRRCADRSRRRTRRRRAPRSSCEISCLERSSIAPEADRDGAAALEGWTIERLPTIDRLLLRDGHLRVALPSRHAARRRHQRGGRARQEIFDRRFRSFRQWCT